MNCKIKRDEIFTEGDSLIRKVGAKNGLKKFFWYDNWGDFDEQLIHFENFIIGKLEDELQ